MFNFIVVLSCRIKQNNKEREVESKKDGEYRGVVELLMCFCALECELMHVFFRSELCDQMREGGKEEMFVEMRNGRENKRQREEDSCGCAGIC